MNTEVNKSEITRNHGYNTRGGTKLCGISNTSIYDADNNQYNNTGIIYKLPIKWAHKKPLKHKINSLIKKDKIIYYRRNKEIYLKCYVKVFLSTNKKSLILRYFRNLFNSFFLLFVNFLFQFRLFFFFLFFLIFIHFSH